MVVDVEVMTSSVGNSDIFEEELLLFRGLHLFTKTIQLAEFLGREVAAVVV